MRLVTDKNTQLTQKNKELENLNKNQTQLAIPNKLLSDQITHLRLLQEIFELINNINETINDIKHLLTYNNIPITEEQKLQIQLQLQQLKNLVQIQQKICIDFNSLLKKTTYDFLLPQNRETSVLFIKADMDKIIVNLSELIRKHNENNQ